MSRTRSDADYTIEALLKGLSVLEALEGNGFEPVTTRRVQQRTGLSYDFCFRALTTLLCHGVARQTPGGWVLSPRYIAFCERAARAQIKL
jgi:DNA-binding IclR family transcriptional regulator